MLVNFLWAIIPTLFCSVFFYFFTKKDKARDKRVEERAEARREESLLALEMQMATAKLAYASAMALERGKTNGEVKGGVDAYKEAKEKYFDFINRQYFKER